jgi:hypothetical protein
MYVTFVNPRWPLPLARYTRVGVGRLKPYVCVDSERCVLYAMYGTHRMLRVVGGGQAGMVDMVDEPSSLGEDAILRAGSIEHRELICYTVSKATTFGPRPGLDARPRGLLLTFAVGGRGEARRAWKMLQEIPGVTHHARPIFSAGLARAGVDLIEVEGGGVEIVYASRGCARGTVPFIVEPRFSHSPHVSKSTRTSLARCAVHLPTCAICMVVA